MENLLKTAYATNSPAFALVHNHPSGIVTPSTDDKSLVDRIRNGAAIFGFGSPRFREYRKLLTGQTRHGREFLRTMLTGPIGFTPLMDGQQSGITLKVKRRLDSY